MVTLQVLGMGCQKCNVLAERTAQAARELGLDFQLEKITEIGQIARFGIMSTPALAVDGQVRLQGHVPTVHTLKGLIESSSVKR